MNPLSLKEFNGMVGLPISSTIVAIKDDEGKNLNEGERGEICIKAQVMQGYWQRPEETAQVMTDDGYFRTGDIGIMDKDGYVKMLTAKKI